jgi:pimeloyl-ACP methyl ester carboxylesterase
MTAFADLGNVVPQLESAGYSIVTLDLPCHGADGVDVPAVPPGSGESLNLLCIAQRIAAGDQDIFLRFCSQLSDALDSLGVSSAAILGVSRGGGNSRDPS